MVNDDGRRCWKRRREFLGVYGGSARKGVCVFSQNACGAFAKGYR